MLLQLYSLLSPKERLQALYCFAAMVLMGLIDVIGVASIMPFIAVIADPDAVTHHAKLAWLYQYFHFTSNYRFLIFLGVLVLCVLLIGNGISMFTSWLIFKFTYAREYSLSKRLFQQYLYQPYLFFLNRNVSELSKNILTEVTEVVNHAFIPAMQLIAKSIVTILILLLLLFIDPILSLVIGGILGGAYLGIYSLARNKLSIISKHNLEDNREKYKITSEALLGIKDLKLLGREHYFLDRFAYFAKRHARNEATANVIAQLPRFALETIAFGSVLVIIIYLLMIQHQITNALPILALYAFAALRLMPALQQIFISIAFIRASKEALNTLSTDLVRVINTASASTLLTAETVSPLLRFEKEIELRNIDFYYPNSSRPIITGLNLKIPINTTIGFVGITGAGKTTIVDIILDLLKPSQGQVLIDGVPLCAENSMSWRKKIGYVPQTIYLADDSVIRNIAFGISDDNIDMMAVEKAARIANIHHFVINELAHGYDTIIGDRGIRLSGGQRQRLGIARALYHSPEILVLDEATNALDGMTESAIMDAIAAIAHRKTIIMVAHKLSALKECDQIYMFEKNGFYTVGTYQELMTHNQKFRALAGE